MPRDAAPYAQSWHMAREPINYCKGAPGTREQAPPPSSPAHSPSSPKQAAPTHIHTSPAPIPSSKPILCRGMNTMVSWKMAVLVAIVTIVTLMDFDAVEAQVTGCTSCATNARCYYSRYSGYYCACRRGYTGDGNIGTGYSGCRKRKLRTWQVVLSILGAILGALLILCLCLACIRNALTRRRARGPVGDPAYGYPQQAHPQQGVPMYETNLNNQKVPGPAGVV